MENIDTGFKIVNLLMLECEFKRTPNVSFNHENIDTNVEIICASCLQDFNVELPLESSFFFPRRKKATNTQV